ncbi:MAG: type IV toxin-antitoxin system AbiEi family antitoxin domain-containing protein [Acidimicrobiia bacterium]
MGNAANRVAAHARRQHGLFTLRQARDAGYSSDAVARRLRANEWEEVDHRVLRVLPAAQLTWRQRLTARTLSTGGVSSCRSAAVLYGLLEEPVPLDVTVLRSSRTASHAQVRSTIELPAGDVVMVDDIRATTPVRTLIDLGAVIGRDRLEDVLDVALMRGPVTPRRLAARAVELWTPRRAGCAIVLGLLQVRSPQTAMAASLWEARVLRDLRSLGLPQPCCNYEIRVGGRRRCIDFAWPDARVALEFDGFAFHSSRRVFDDDRARQNDLVDAGWRVYRLTASALSANPRRAVAPIARALGLDW